MAMKISWTSLKVSIAGAKLSHLVERDKIWDHGSMTEQVKAIFYQVEKAKKKGEAELVRKYLSEKGFNQLTKLFKTFYTDPSLSKNAILTQISIIDVNAQTTKSPDRFTAFIKGKRNSADVIALDRTKKEEPAIENFSEKWFFVRQGEWWVLDEMKR
jgi:PDZ domain-containing secreted protein